MPSVRVRIVNKKGLHARAAAKLVKTASLYPVRVQVTRVMRPGETMPDNAPPPSAGATSILSLLMLAAEKGVEVDLSAEGDEAPEALAAMELLIGRKFDEEE
jgi:phosphocarrier protein HPr